MSTHGHLLLAMWGASPVEHALVPWPCDIGGVLGQFCPLSMSGDLQASGWQLFLSGATPGTIPDYPRRSMRMIACWRGVFTDFGPYAVKNTANPKIRWMTVSQQEGRRRMAIAPRGMGPHYGM